MLDEDFYDDEYYQNISCEMINDSASELEVLEKIDMIRKALSRKSEVYKELSMLRPRIKSYLKKDANGVLPPERFDVNMNRILESANGILSRLKSKDIAIDFHLDNYNGLIYRILSTDRKKLLFKYIGELVNYQPHGRGKAFYPDGSYYVGEFRHGNRDGEGILYNRNKVVLREGSWKYDKYFEKNGIKFFENIKVAADSIHAPSDIQEFNCEIIKIPNLLGDGMIAFPLEGDSMEPNFFEGEIVVCREMDNWDKIKDHKEYVIFHDGRLVLKRVKKIIVKDEETSYQLISDNYMNHNPYIITPTNETRFFKLLMHMRPHK